MPEINKKKMNNQKKAPLGRGLGSLLSTGMQDFEPTKSKEKKTQVAEYKKETVPAAKATPPSKIAKPIQKAAKPKTVASPVPIQVAPQKTDTDKVSPKSVQKETVTGTASDIDRIWNLAIDKVHPNKRQPRKDFEKEPLKELSDSIKAQGILQPITVRKVGETFEIIAGERRWRAAQLAGLHQVPVLIKNVSDQKVMELALIENIQREDLNAVEEAIAYQQLIEDYKLTQEEVAQKVGKNRSTVTNSLRMLTLPKEIKKAIRNHDITVGHAKVLLSGGDPEQQVELLKTIMAKKLSVRALEMEIRMRKSTSGNIKGMDVSERLSQGLATELQKVMGTKVKIKYKKGRGRLEISFYSDAELTALSEKLKDAWQPNP